MNARSKTSVQTISKDLFSAISLRELGSGALLCVWPDGKITERYGREVAPASLSPRLAKALGLTTSGTYGPPSTGLSSSVDLSSSLASKLRARTDLIGSILYRLTWKDRVTPAGRSIPALRGSPLRISGKGSTGSGSKASPTPPEAERVTPSARDWKDTGEIRPRADGTERLDQLPRQAFLCGWPTPCQQDGPNGGPGQGSDRLPGCAPLAGWPSPTVGNASGGQSPPEGTTAQGQTPDGRKVTVALPYVVGLSGWPTPAAKIKAGGEYSDPEKTIAGVAGPHANDLRDFVQMTGWPTPQAGNPAGNTDSSRKTTAIAATIELRFIPSTIGEMPTGSCVVIPTARVSGPLNPAHSLWLMLGAFATVWRQCAERVTRSTSPRRKASSKPQSK